MLRLLFLLLFASNSFSATLSQDVITGEQGLIVELHSSFSKVDSEENDCMTALNAVFACHEYRFTKRLKGQSLSHQKQFDHYVPRAPPASQISFHD